MTREEYLLACVSEECGEITQIACKAQRFGLDNTQGINGEAVLYINRQELQKEYSDLIGVLQMLGIEPDVKQVRAKHEKLLRYMDLSRELGRLDP